MFVSVRASGSTDVGAYLIDRDDDAFMIIEGNARRFDAIAEQVLLNNQRRKISHYSYVLSFKDENTTKEEIFTYYQKFKELMFSNYDASELEIFSIIHWDDNKPHVHCVVSNASQFNAQKDLQLFRGFTDFARVEAVQEKINYEYSLESPFDNINLLSLTYEQKKRDWRVKKREIPFYKVFDDDFFKIAEEGIKQVHSFDEFIQYIQSKVGKTLLQTPTKFNKEASFNEAFLLKEHRLVLLDKLTTNGDTYSYTSKLFDKKWFEKYLLKLKEALNETSVTNIKYSERRKSLSKYEKIYEETTEKHEKHLFARKVGKKYLGENLDAVLELSLGSILEQNISKQLNPMDIEIFENTIERFLSNANEYYLLKFIESFDYEKTKITGSLVKFYKNDNVFTIADENLLKYMQQKSMNFDKNKKDITLLKYDFHQAAATLKSHKSKSKARSILENIFYEEKIKTKDELEVLFSQLGLSVVKVGYDIKRGNYLTLSYNSEKFSIYNDAIAGTYAYQITLDAQPSLLSEQNNNGYNLQRDVTIEQNISERFLKNYALSVYKDYMGIKQIDSCNAFRLKKTPSFKNMHFQSFHDTVSYSYQKNRENQFEELVDNGNSIDVYKSLHPVKTGINLADTFFLKGSKDIRVSALDKEIIAGMISRIKEKKYNISIWDNNDNLIFTPLKEDIVLDTNIDAIADEIVKNLEIDVDKMGSMSLMDLVSLTQKLNMRSQEDIKIFLDIISTLNTQENNFYLEAFTNSLGIKAVCKGNDEKGNFTTFMYKGVQINHYGISVNISAQENKSLYVVQ